MIPVDHMATAAKVKVQENFVSQVTDGLENELRKVWMIGS